MEFLSELTPAEIWEHLEKSGYHWGSKEERLVHWGDYGFFYERLRDDAFRIVYTRESGYYDVMKVTVEKRPGGSLLTAKAPWWHTNSKRNDAVEMIKIHLLKRDE